MNCECLEILFLFIDHLLNIVGRIPYLTLLSILKDGDDTVVNYFFQGCEFDIQCRKKASCAYIVKKKETPDQF